MVILKMLFLILSNANIQFADKKLILRFYTTKQVLHTIQKKELIGKKKFAKAALNKNIEAIIVHMASHILKMIIYLAQKAQIALLLAKKVTAPT